MSKKIISKRIAAGMVLFNPNNMNRFQHSIDSILKQVDKLYIFDNSKKQISYKPSSKIIYKSEHENKGIAYALNQIMVMAKNDKYEWVVTMDQDSILPEGIIYDYEKHIDIDNKIAIICPQIIDKRRIYMEIKKEPEKEYIKQCITSASCTSITAWEKIGGFDSWLFIDLVDNEFCKRLYVSNYKILRLNKWILDQEFGEIIPKSPKVQEFWIKMSKIFHNENIAKLSYRKYVNPVRVYYTNRNIIYVNKKMKKYGATAYENYNCKGYLGFLISFSLPSLLRAQKKRQVLKAIICGIRDGMKRKVITWKVEY